MGFLDNVTSAVNRGTASAGRAAEKVKLNSRISELTKKRQGLAAQLGASLYEATKDNEELRKGREALYDGIAECDRERDECQHQIDQIDEQNQAQAVASSTFKCAVCGAPMSGSDLFCSGCGTPAEKARPAATAAPVAAGGPKCAKCGAPMNENDMFCMSCGAKVEPPATSENAQDSAMEEK